MFSADTNGPDCWKCSLNVEWHDCSWCPAIVQRRGIEIRSGAAAKPLPSPSVLPNPDHRKNLPKPMKKILSAPRRSGAAFTLVELLTVIAIIGILAAMLMPVFSIAVTKAKVMRAKTEIQGIATAVEGYESAYGRFPTTNQVSGTATFGGSVLASAGFSTPSTLDNSQVVSILMDFTSYPGSGASTVNFSHVKNPQQTKFLNAKMSGDTSSPGVGTDLIYRDPWGNPYVISMDLTFNDLCEDAFYKLSGISSGGINGLILQSDGNYAFRGKVMVWSAGPDGKISPLSSLAPAKTPPNKDNVLSWQ